jgi:hypothetical protein
VTSSTFSSRGLASATFLVKIALFTMVILVTYWKLVQFMGNKAIYGETSLNSGLLRLQSLADSRESSNIIIGTSLTAKLKSDLIFEKFNGTTINLGIDGGVPIFGAKKVLESTTKPEVILIEANFIGKQPNSNMATLEDETRSARFKAARFIPVLRQEYRPSTLFYSEFKSIKDDFSTQKNNKKSKVNSTTIKPLSLFKPGGKYNVPTEKKRRSILSKLKNIEREWELILGKLKNNETEVIFIMLPDGKDEREASYIFTRHMAIKYDIPFIDLKSQLKNDGLSYSDGLHLAKKSAIRVSKILNMTLRRVPKN